MEVKKIIQNGCLNADPGFYLARQLNILHLAILFWSRRSKVIMSGSSIGGILQSCRTNWMQYLIGYYI